MTSYYLKIIYKNKFNLIPLFVILIVPTLILYFNSLNPGLLGSIDNEISAANHLLSTTEIEEQIIALEQQIEENQEFLNNYNSANYSTAYNDRLNKLNFIKQNELESGFSTPESQLMLEELIVELEALSELNLEHDSVYSPKKGLNNMVFNWMDNLVPILFSIIIALLASDFFTLNYRNGIDIEKTYPMSLLKLQTIKLMTFILATLILYTIFSILNFVIPSSIYGAGSFSYPYVGFNKLGTNFEIYNLKLLLQQGVILQILCIILLILTVAFLSKWIQNKLYLFFLVSFIVFIQIFAVDIIPVLKGIAHLFPFYYFQFVKIISYRALEATGNSNLSFQFGVGLLLVSNLLVMLSLYLIKKENGANE